MSTNIINEAKTLINLVISKTEASGERETHRDECYKLAQSAIDSATAELRATIENLSDHGSGAERMRFIDALQAQVETLKGDYIRSQDLAGRLVNERDVARAEVERLKKALNRIVHFLDIPKGLHGAYDMREIARAALNSTTPTL